MPFYFATTLLFISVFSPLIAAQGQITEVNPSGVHDRVVILQADEGEEVDRVKGASFLLLVS